MAKQVLVIIDPQNDFTHPKGQYARKHPGLSKIGEARAAINNLLALFPPEDTVIVRSHYQPGQFAPGVSLCIPGTFGFEIDAALQVKESAPLLTKTGHSCFSSEAFRDLLRTGPADTLILCGFLAEYCVKQTACDALSLGYTTVLVDDGIATGDDVHHRKQEAFAALTAQGAVVVRSRDLYAAAHP